MQRSKCNLTSTIYLQAFGTELGNGDIEALYHNANADSSNAQQFGLLSTQVPFKPSSFYFCQAFGVELSKGNVEALYCKGEPANDSNF